MGESFKSIEYSFRISRTLISSIITECCEAIFEALGPTRLKTPNNVEDWLSTAVQFECRWNFPNGLGAIDGKRIIIQQPDKSGSPYFDYKGPNSIILLAVFSPNYECIWADVGTNGRSSEVKCNLFYYTA